MSEEIVLLSLLVRTAGKSEFRLRCHSAAWSTEYCGNVKMTTRRREELPGLLMLSATGPDTAAKAVRAALYEPEIQTEFILHGENLDVRLAKARGAEDGKAVSYTAAVAKLAPGVVHLVALAKIPGLMPNLSDDHLWTELSGPRYTTPLLRRWTPWLKDAMAANGGIVIAEGYGAEIGVLKTEPDALDQIVSQGVRDRQLALSA